VSRLTTDPGSPELELAAHDLRAIADGLDSLANAGGVRVEHFEIHGWQVAVRRQDSQMDGVSYVVTGIERKPR